MAESENLARKKPPARVLGIAEAGRAYAVTAVRQGTMLEQHYSPVELAKRWGFSGKFVRKLFAKEPGVIVIDHPEEMHKRGWTSMRIPESVADRVYARLRTRG